MTITQILDKWIDRYRSERDALNVALAKLQCAYAWIIAQEKCPECYGEIIDDTSQIDNHVITFYQCCDCGKRWNYIGNEMLIEDIVKWKDTIVSQELGKADIEPKSENDVIEAMLWEKYKP